MQIWEENGMKIGIKNAQEIKCMRESGRILGLILHELERMVVPGVTALDIDTRAAELMEQYNVLPSFKGYNGFPNVICANINEQVVHGIPTDRILHEGDIITIDCGVIFEEFHSDSAITVAVGNISPEAQRLIKVTEKALHKGIQAVRPGKRVRNISKAIEKTIAKGGFCIVRDLVGHGIGKKLHEDPPVPNFVDADSGPILQPGMTIAIEPITTAKTTEIVLEDDGWTYITAEKCLAAQIEHTVLVTEQGFEILTQRPL